MNSLHQYSTDYKSFIWTETYNNFRIRIWKYLLKNLIIVMLFTLALMTPEDTFAWSFDKVNKAKDFIRMEQYNDADDILKAEIKNNPMNLKAQFWMGVVYLEQGKSKHAGNKFLNIEKETDKYNEKMAQRLVKKAFRSKDCIFLYATAMRIDKSTTVKSYNFFIDQYATKDQKKRIEDFKIIPLHEFDYISAQQDYQPEQIAKFLSKKTGFDYDQAIKQGRQPKEISDYMFTSGRILQTQDKPEWWGDFSNIEKTEILLNVRTMLMMQ